MADPTATPKGPFDALILPFINDERDTVFVYLALQCTALALFGLCLFIPGVLSWWTGALYLALWGFGVLDRYILMLHCVSHRPLFNRKYRWLRGWIPWVLGPFFGQTPETYFTHHMGMHHVEGNLEGDLSSTMRFRRDRFTHWLRYFGGFLVFGLVQLAVYHKRRGKQKLFRRTVLGELSWYLIAAVALLVHWPAALVVFVGPLLTVRALMMAGNWGQHAFIDAAQPDNDFKSSITCINTRYNRRCFNDGYHIIHHLKPALHYTEMAAEFDANREQYGAQDAIVFEGIDFFQVWLYLMLGKKDWLAKAFVQLPGAPERNHEQVVSFLNSRLAPVIRT